MYPDLMPGTAKDYITYLASCSDQDAGVLGRKKTGLPFRSPTNKLFILRNIGDAGKAFCEICVGGNVVTHFFLVVGGVGCHVEVAGS